MSKIDLTIPSLGDKFVDLRGILPGDAFSWSWERPLSSVNFLAIHHSGSDDQNPQDIANYHINTNNWGGIGYHFLVSDKGLVYYVGDISTARSSVVNLNDQILGIALMGNFILGKEPSDEQIQATKKLCEALINNQDLSNLTSWNCVKGHKELPNQKTNCPSDTWDEWKEKITGGIEPKAAPQLADSYNNQVENLKASLEAMTKELLSMQETLGQKELQINDLRKSLNSKTLQNGQEKNMDHTLTIIGGLINLYKVVFLPRKVD